MKVYSWKTLINVLAGGVFFVYKILHFDGLSDLIFLAFLAYLIIEGLFVSFSEEAYQQDMRRAERSKRVNRKLFGPFAPVIRWSPMIFLLLSYGGVKLLPTWKWFIGLCLLAALACSICITILFKKHMKLEEAREQAAFQREESGDAAHL